MVSRQILVALISGVLFGAGLALSGMADPSRVRAFLDVAGDWDPTLAFVMGGALIPMALAWRVKRRLDHPMAASAFDVPDTRGLDVRLEALRGRLTVISSPPREEMRSRDRRHPAT